MYGLIYKDIFESSLMAQGGADTVYVFMSMITLADKDDCIRSDPRTLATKIDKPVEIVESAISVLASADKDSNIPDHDGRRIIPLSEIKEVEGNRGFFIVNRDHYIKLSSSNNTRSVKERVNKHRKKKQILDLINNLDACNVTETFNHDYIYIYIYISINIFKYLLDKKVDLNAWAEYEEYRRNVLNAPMKSDQGRKVLINKLIQFSLASNKTHAEIIQQSIDNEWKGLFPIDEKNVETINKSKSLLETIAHERNC